MICQPCAAAADWVPARPLYDGIPEVAASEREQAHMLCIGAGSCACQHRVPTPLRTEGSTDA
jgi:hypothetical protein